MGERLSYGAIHQSWQARQHCTAGWREAEDRVEVGREASWRPGSQAQPRADLLSSLSLWDHDVFIRTMGLDASLCSGKFPPQQKLNQAPGPGRQRGPYRLYPFPTQAKISEGAEQGVLHGVGAGSPKTQVWFWPGVRSSK